jgi:hypothetical protein
MRQPQYWLGVNPSVYEDSKRKYDLSETHPFGFPKGRRTSVKEMQIGDRIVNYMTGFRRFFAVYEIVSGHVTNNSYVLSDTSYPEWVEVRPVILRSPEKRYFDG